MNRRYLVIAAGAVVLGAAASSADVGYAMRGDAQPFHHWDSVFNTSAGVVRDEGWVIRARSLAVRPHLGVWAGWYDNVYLEPADGVEDTYWTVAPGVMVLWGHEHDDYLALNAVYEDTHFTDATDLDFDSRLFSGALRLVGGRNRLHLSDQYSRTTDTNPEVARRTSKTLNVQSLVVQRDVSGKTDLEARQFWEVHDYQDDGLLDYDEWGVSLGGRYRLTARMTPRVSVGAGRVEMERSEALSDAWYTELRAGVHQRLTAKTTLHADAGWQRRDFDEDTVETIDEWVVGGGLVSRISRRTDWSLDAVRRLTPSSSQDGVTRAALGVFPSVRHILWYDRLACHVRGGYEWAEYIDPAGETDREDTYWYVSALLEWQPQRPFTVGLGYTHTEQDSNRDGGDYEQDHVFVRALLNY